MSTSRRQDDKKPSSSKSKSASSGDSRSKRDKRDKSKSRPLKELLDHSRSSRKRIDDQGLKLKPTIDVGGKSVVKIPTLSAPNVEPETGSSRSAKLASEAALGSLKLGDVVVFNIPPTIPDEAVAASLLVSATSGNPWASIKFDRPINAIAIRAQSAMPTESWASLAGTCLKDRQIVAKRKRLSNVGGISLLSPAGIIVLQKKLVELPRDIELLVLDLSWPKQADAAGLVGFSLLCGFSRSTGCAVVLFISDCPDNDSLRSVAQLDDIVKIEKCLPDTDAVISFKVIGETCGHFWMGEPDGSMVSLLKADGGVRWRHEKFVADDPASREILRMRRAGKTLEQIGKSLDHDASTIKRRIDKLEALGTRTKFV